MLGILLPSLVFRCEPVSAAEPTRLNSLRVWGEAFGDAEAPVLAQLTQLQCPSFSQTPTLADAGLDQLTVGNLNLVHLVVCESGISEATCNNEDGD